MKIFSISYRIHISYGTLLCLGIEITKLVSRKYLISLVFLKNPTYAPVLCYRALRKSSNPFLEKVTNTNTIKEYNFFPKITAQGFKTYEKKSQSKQLQNITKIFTKITNKSMHVIQINHKGNVLPSIKELLDMIIHIVRQYF